MTPNELKKQFDKLDNDLERWEWLIENRDEDLTVFLDSGCTYVQFGGSEEDLYGDISNYLGWSSGAYKLLNAIGIKVSSV